MLAAILIQSGSAETYDKVLVVEVAVSLGIRMEDREVLCQSNETAERQCNVAAPQTERRLVSQLAALVVNSLSPSGLDEVDVRDEDGDPGEQTEDTDEIHEIAEDGGRRA